MWKLNWSRKLNLKSCLIPGLWSRYSTQPMFYYPERSRPIMRNMDLWKLIIKFRNEHSGKRLSFRMKELFYQDAQKVLERAVYLLEKYTIPVTSTIQIAQVSAVNSDYSLACTIAEAFNKVGPVGLKMIVEGKNFNDELDVVTGFQLSKVAIHPMFVTESSGIDVFSNCSLILYGDKLESFDEIKELINEIKSKKKDAIYIFLECERKALHDILQMKLKEKLNIVAVELVKPNIASSTSLKDISILTGTPIIRKNFKALPLEEIVGNIDTAYFTEDELLMLGMKLDETNLFKHMSGLVETNPPEDLSIFQNRMYTLMNNKVAVIKIGGIDEIDVRKRMGMAVDTLGRAEEAVNHGLIVGGGRCLSDVIQQVSDSITYTQQINGATIVVDAMKYFYDLMSSENESVYDLSSKESLLVPRFFGYDKKTKQYVNLIANGILDPKSYFAKSLKFANQKCLQYLKGAGGEDESP